MLSKLAAEFKRQFTTKVDAKNPTFLPTAPRITDNRPATSLSPKTPTTTRVTDNRATAMPKIQEAKAKLKTPTPTPSKPKLTKGKFGLAAAATTLAAGAYLLNKEKTAATIGELADNPDKKRRKNKRAKQAANPKAKSNPNPTPKPPTNPINPAQKAMSKITKKHLALTALATTTLAGGAYGYNKLKKQAALNLLGTQTQTPTQTPTSEKLADSNYYGSRYFNSMDGGIGARALLHRAAKGEKGISAREERILNKLRQDPDIKDKSYRGSAFMTSPTAAATVGGIAGAASAVGIDLYTLSRIKEMEEMVDYHNLPKDILDDFNRLKPSTLKRIGNPLFQGALAAGAAALGTYMGRKINARATEGQVNSGRKTFLVGKPRQQVLKSLNK